MSLLWAPRGRPAGSDTLCSPPVPPASSALSALTLSASACPWAPTPLVPALWHQVRLVISPADSVSPISDSAFDPPYLSLQHLKESLGRGRPRPPGGGGGERGEKPASRPQGQRPGQRCVAVSGASVCPSNCALFRCMEQSRKISGYIFLSGHRNGQHQHFCEGGFPGPFTHMGPPTISSLEWRPAPQPSTQRVGYIHRPLGLGPLSRGPQASAAHCHLERGPLCEPPSVTGAR